MDRLSRFEDHPHVRLLFEHLGVAPAALRSDDTRHVQPATYVAGLVAAEASDAALVMGHSLGEITAATWAGAIDVAAGLDLLRRRGELAREAHRERPGAMVAINRWPLDRIEVLRRRAQFRTGGVLDVAVINSPTQIVVSGDLEAIRAITTVANDSGAVARILPIDGAFHSSLLAGSVDRFRETVTAAVTTDPKVPMILGSAARACTTAAELIDLLALGLISTVDWPRAIGLAMAHGVTTLIDAGPGNTITRLGRHLRGPETVEP